MGTHADHPRAAIRRVEDSSLDVVGEVQQLISGSLRIGEPSFREMLLFWNQPSLDATALGYAAFYLLDNLSESTWYSDFCNEYRNALKDFFARHWDAESGGFKHSTNPHAWPTIYGTFYAIRLARIIQGQFPGTKDWRYLKKGVLDDLGENARERVIKFIRRCEDAETHGFAEHPGGLASLDTTMAVRSLLRSLDLKKSGGTNKEAADGFIEKCKRTISIGNTSVTGYCDRPSDEHTSVHVWRHVDQSHRCALDIQMFAPSCKAEDGGMGPLPNSGSNLLDTRELMLTYEAATQPPSQKVTFEWVSGIPGYLNQWRRKGFRFGFRPESPANIRSMRDGLDIARILEGTAVSVFEPSDYSDVALAIFDHMTSDGLFVGYAAFRPRTEPVSFLA